MIIGTNEKIRETVPTIIYTSAGIMTLIACKKIYSCYRFCTRIQGATKLSGRSIVIELPGVKQEWNRNGTICKEQVMVSRKLKESLNRSYRIDTGNIYQTEVTNDPPMIIGKIDIYHTDVTDDLLMTRPEYLNDTEDLVETYMYYNDGRQIFRVWIMSLTCAFIIFVVDHYH